MSVETQINRIKANIASAYAKAAEKGAELPTVQDSENLPGTIEGIPAGGLPEGVHTITLTADPPEGGSVSGGGVSSDGMTVTIRAEPNTDGSYAFECWKKDDVVVSDQPEYTFDVSSDLSIIAMFLYAPYIAGADWWPATLPSSANWSSVAYGSGKFVAIASSSNKAAYSTDGVNWTAATLPSSANWRSVAYGSGKFVAIASNRNVAYSTDGINWTATTLPSSTSATWESVTYGNGKFVAITGTTSGENDVAYSTDGIMQRLGE